MPLMDHLKSHINNQQVRSNNTLWVIGVISNTARFHTRIRLYKEWLKAMEETAHVKVVTVECAYGDRHFEVTEANNPFNLQLRTNSEIWTKECMINLAIKHLLPLNYRYVAWIDCDVFFKDPNWAQETIHQLQHFDVIQPWSDGLDMGPHGEVLQHFRSFGRQHQLRVQKQTHPSQPYHYAHSGFAWAATRTFIENTRGLMEFGILGSNDHHQAFAMVGNVKDTIHSKMSTSFFRKCLEWELWAMKITHGEVGYINGTIMHRWHGQKKNRKYRERWQILIDNSFCPDKDLMYDAQGLIQLVGKPKLEHDIHNYILQRSEDSIDVY